MVNGWWATRGVREAGTRERLLYCGVVPVTFKDNMGLGMSHGSAYEMSSSVYHPVPTSLLKNSTRSYGGGGNSENDVRTGGELSIITI